MMVEASNIFFRYEKDKSVLDNVSFNVKKGDIFGITGSSGCGKSTLLRIISGLLRREKEYYFSGLIKVNGDEDTLNLRKKGMIGLMFQQPSLLPNLTLKENIILPTMMNSSHKPNKEYADKLINVAGLSKSTNKFPKQLSGGMQKRAELLRTFITKPQLLLLDEPFSSLDYGWKMDLYSELINLTQQINSTVIIVSHDINELVLLTNRIMVLSKSGKIIDDNIILRNKPTMFSAKKASDYLIANNNISFYIQSMLLKEKK